MIQLHNSFKIPCKYYTVTRVRVPVREFAHETVAQWGRRTLIVPTHKILIGLLDIGYWIYFIRLVSCVKNTHT